jgi:hypothetical protein
MAHREPVKLDAGPLLAAAAALLLLVSLFLDWYGRAGVGESAITGWTAFEVHDLLLALIGLLALSRAAGALGATTHRGPQVPLWALGAAALVLVGSQVLNHPPAAIDAEVRVGAWLALGASLLLLVAGLLNRVRVSIVGDDPGKSARVPEPGSGAASAGDPAPGAVSAGAPPRERAPFASAEDGETETRPLPGDR